MGFILQREGKKLLFLFLFLLILTARTVHAASEEKVYTTPMEDGSGMVLTKGTDFTCRDSEGNLHTSPAVHHFDRLEVGGTVFDGYYYHPEDGMFHPGNPEFLYLENIPCEDAVFEGFYMASNLGQLSGAPKVRYLSGLTLHDITFEGYYYFDRTGKLDMSSGIHTLEMDENGVSFRGSYYFGGENGSLLMEAGTTPQGFPVDETGRVEFSAENPLESLEGKLTSLMESCQGDWSVYVKDLSTDQELYLNPLPMTSASLIKLFVMEKTYRSMDRVRKNQAEKTGLSPDSPEVDKAIQNLLWNMITVSDNESCNELVRLQSSKNSFTEGAERINEYLARKGYSDTTVQHTLHPSSSQSEGLGGGNMTSAADCGKILERIYKGECVSPEASGEMINLLINQETDWKIPAGLPGDVPYASKSGETDQNQHDAAIIYGPVRDYVLCVMSQGCPDEGDAIHAISEISSTVYLYLNLE